VAACFKKYWQPPTRLPYFIACVVENTILHEKDFKNNLLYIKTASVVALREKEKGTAEGD